MNLFGAFTHQMKKLGKATFSMLDKLQLKNFKIFEDTGTMDFAPLTLLFGQNSAGKSSILQALALLKQTLDNDNPKECLVFSMEDGLVDLDNYKNVVYMHDAENNKISIKFGFCINELILASPITKWLDTIPVSTVSVSITFDKFSDKVIIDNYKLYFDDNDESAILWANDRGLLVQSIEGGLRENVNIQDFYFISKINENLKFWKFFYEEAQKHIALYTEQIKNNKDFGIKYKNLIESENEFEFAENLNLILNNLDIFSYQYCEFYFPDLLCNKVSMCEDLNKHDYGAPLEQILQEMFYRQTDYPYSFGEDYNEFNLDDINNLTLTLYSKELLKSVCYEFYELMRNTYFIGPFRCKFERVYKKRNKMYKYVGFSGGYTPYLLQSTPGVINKINDYLDILDIGYIIEIEDILNSEYFSVSLRDISKNMKIPISDAGFGITQLLPIVCQAAIATNSTIVIEQPELHIHPALQARLGTFFERNYKDNNNQFIIETHSEHLILRLQRLVRNKSLRPQDISVLQASRINKTKISTITQIRIDDEGEIADIWPGGFFPERLREFLD